MLSVPPHSENNLGWSEIECKAQHTMMATFARIAKRSKISLREIARRCGRDPKNLRQTFLAANPKNISVEEIGVALGIRRDDIRAKLRGHVNREELNSQRTHELERYRDELLTSPLVDGSVYKILLSLVATYSDLMAVEPTEASEDQIVFARDRFAYALEAITSLRKRQIAAERPALATAKRLLDDLKRCRASADRMPAALSKVPHPEAT